MSYAERLRSRILSALGAGALTGLFVPTGCGGTETRAKEQTLEPSSCGAERGQVQCFAPGSTHFNVGEQPPDSGAPQLPEPVFDENGCQVMEQVRDGCCNAAVTGPELIDGRCCYGFCASGCCGRPFVVDGRARLAGVERRSDWLAELDLDGVDALDVATREALSRAWLADARLEHASIASFARFTLDLLAFGAPLELVREASRAQSDEAEHAAVCFALASRYLGAPHGPGALAMTGVQPSRSLAEAAASAAREGCIGETVAAWVAAERAPAARDPAVRAVLERIAEDEARHAELAWRFVRWALENGADEVRAAVAAVLGDLPLGGEPASPDPVRDPVLADQGWVTPERARALEHCALREVVEPCARALFATFALQRLPKRQATCKNVRPA